MSLTFDVSNHPRGYQQEALKWGLGREGAVCCLPTGTGKTLIGLLWAKALMESGQVRRVLILEPTRLLVNQIVTYYDEKANVECVPVDGRLAPEIRQGLWSHPLVVATPHAAYNDRHWLDFDAVIVDECHHTVGQDAFAKLMDAVDFRYKLGLSATIPEKREMEIVLRIGPIRRWSWTDPGISKFVPLWLGEVYDAELRVNEQAVLEHVRSLPGFAGGLLQRFLTRDGAPALVETLSGSNRLAREYGSGILPMVKETTFHKMDALREVFDSHDFTKAIVFVDRKIVAYEIAQSFPEYQPVLLLGGKDKSSQQHALMQARTRDCRLVIATRAGEEGIDLPEIDLAISWGSVASEIRFVQRHGRLMRGQGLKFAVFIVTPETIDLDSFTGGLERAQAAGQIDVLQTFGWEPAVLWPKTTWWHLTETLRRQPRPLEGMGQALGIREEKVENLIKGALDRGRLFYFYDIYRIQREFIMARILLTTFMSRGQVEAQGPARSLSTPEVIELLRSFSEEELEYLRRKLREFSTGALNSEKNCRLYGLAEEADAIRRSNPGQFTVDGEALVLLEPLKLTLGFGSRLLGRVSVPAVLNEANRELVESLRRELEEALARKGMHKRSPKKRERGTAPAGFCCFGRKKGRLKFYFVPRTPEVLSLLAANALKLSEVEENLEAMSYSKDLQTQILQCLAKQ